MSKNYKGYQLNESQCRYAMSNTMSNAEAAIWLRVSFSTWKKYALMYIDSETGKSLYKLHRDTGADKRALLPKNYKHFKKNRNSTFEHRFKPTDMQEIFENKHQTFNLYVFRNRLLNEGYKEERCECCGYQERRSIDYTVPLKMHWVDGNKKNYALENIEFLCFNCYYIHVGNPFGVDRKYYIDEKTGEPVPLHDRRVPLKQVKLVNYKK